MASRLYLLIAVAVVALVLLEALSASLGNSAAPPLENSSSLPASNFSASSYNEFAVEFYKRLALRHLGENFTVSPFSVYKAFVMVYAGAGGETREEIKRVFGFGEDPCDVAPAGRGVEEAVSAWLQTGAPFTQQYLERLACLRAEVHRVDFYGNFKAAIEEINRWVEEKTHGLVKRLVPPNQKREINAVLVSALYLEAGWWPHSFFRVGKGGFAGAARPVEYMALDLRSCGDPSLVGKIEDDITVVKLPLKNTEIAMYIVVPRDFKAYVSSLTYEKLREDLSNLTTEVVYIKMPIFVAEFKGSIKEVLEEMGVRRAFVPFEADLSPMVGSRSLYLGDVFHGAYVKAYEKGIVAAAATAVEAEAICAKVGGAEVVVDRPFLFVLADDRAIYFIGHVVG